MNSEVETPTPAEFPTNGRLLGVDYGTKRVGLAVSSPDQKFAGPLENYNRRTEPLDAKHFLQVVSENRIKALVVGLPVHLSGDEGQKAKESREFGQWLADLTGLPIRYWDERYTSARAEEALLEAGLSKKKRQARLDKLAAQFMLQAYLDAPDREKSPESM
ncbi:Holliday junction resolvase RuvX [Thalassoroseus pseudoceratinae]|uniref:Holliday junction resolvase RuvX n=1 Tax=Thalassoroseus pseudoceratinae TaxID=2713176 RepID=UPI00141DC99E|nr:Holliday junction resolvase RuvX [Thalassoroseus pseudoceratinae]